MIASPITNSSYSDTTVYASTTYYYKVSAVISTIESSQSGYVQATTPSAAFAFTLINKGNKIVNIGSSVNNRINVTATSGTGTVSFSVSGLPAEATASFNPSSCTVTYPTLATCQSKLTIATSATTPAGAYSITVTGTSGAIIRTTSFTLTTQKITPALTLTINPSQTVTQGTTTNVIVGGCPSGLTCTLTRNGATVTPPDSQVLPVGTYTYVYSTLGNSQYNSASITKTLTVNSLVTIPNAPSSLTATALSTTSIRLNWIDNSNNEQGFKIERAKGSGAFTQVATVGLNVATYTDSGLRKRTSYSYRVRAYNTAGNSTYSNTASRSTSLTAFDKVGEFLGI